MKILWLEDDDNVIEATLNRFMAHEFIVAKNLFRFDQLLFNDPGVDEYNFVWIDLSISMGSTPESALLKAFPNLFAGKPPYRLSADRMYGLEYFKNIIWPNERVKDCRTTKFILLSGYTHIVERDGLLAGFPDVLLYKKGIKETIAALAKHLGEVN